MDNLEVSVIVRNKKLIENFIEEAWNHNNFNNLNKYFNDDFIDRSLPPTMQNNVEGMKQWIVGTGKSFEHKTIIEEQITEENKSVIKIRMEMKHIGEFHGLAATGKNLVTTGYRLYYFKDGKISEHFALIDGTRLEKQIKNNV